MSSYFDVWKKFSVFSGRARRTEYWLFEIVNSVVLIVIAGISVLTSPASVSNDGPPGPWLWAYLAFATAVVLPKLAVGVRRLHDSGKSGLWLLIGGVPLLGSIVLFVMMLLPSNEENNPYGPYNQSVQESISLGRL